MTRYLRDFRLIPIVLLAAGSLFALKVSGLVFDGGYTLGERLAKRGNSNNELQTVPRESVPDFPTITYADNAPAAAKKSWAQEMFNFSDSRDVTGSVGSSKPKEAAKPKEEPPKPAAQKVVNPPKDPGGEVIPTEPNRGPPSGERVILERLHERRQELDARGRELEMRETLIKAAEKRLEARVSELKDAETRVKSAIDSRDKAEAARFKGIISMYENMKPKDAARIFDRLEMKILAEVSTQINPRQMSAILAQMSPEAAERLTVELANRASGTDKEKAPSSLPKIEGKPGGR